LRNSRIFFSISSIVSFFTEKALASSKMRKT